MKLQQIEAIDLTCEFFLKVHAIQSIDYKKLSFFPQITLHLNHISQLILTPHITSLIIFYYVSSTIQDLCSAEEIG